MPNPNRAIVGIGVISQPQVWELQCDSPGVVYRCISFFLFSLPTPNCPSTVYMKVSNNSLQETRGVQSLTLSELENYSPVSSIKRMDGQNNSRNQTDIYIFINLTV